MKINFESYGRFYCSLSYSDNEVLSFKDPRFPHHLNECVDFIEFKMEQDPNIFRGVICDWDTGEIVAVVNLDKDCILDDYAEEYMDHMNDCNME